MTGVRNKAPFKGRLRHFHPGRDLRNVSAVLWVNLSAATDLENEPPESVRALEPGILPSPGQPRECQRADLEARPPRPRSEDVSPTRCPSMRSVSSLTCSTATTWTCSSTSCAPPTVTSPRRFASRVWRIRPGAREASLMPGPTRSRCTVSRATMRCRHPYRRSGRRSMRSREAR